jgi:hypothetical protein
VSPSTPIRRLCVWPLSFRVVNDSPVSPGSLPSPESGPSAPNLFPFNNLQRILDNELTPVVTFFVSSALQTAVRPPVFTSLLLYFISSS